MKERSARLSERVTHPAHEVRELAVQLLSFAAKPLRRLCPLPVQHGAKAQPLEERIRHHADGPAAEVVPFLVLGARLRHLHESRFLEQGNGPFYPALTYAGIPHNGAHVDVDEAAGGRGNAQAHGSKQGGSESFPARSGRPPGVLSGSDGSGVTAAGISSDGSTTPWPVPPPGTECAAGLLCPFLWDGQDSASAAGDHGRNGCR